MVIEIHLTKHALQQANERHPRHLAGLVESLCRGVRSYVGKYKGRYYRYIVTADSFALPLVEDEATAIGTGNVAYLADTCLGPETGGQRELKNALAHHESMEGQFQIILPTRSAKPYRSLAALVAVLGIIIGLLTIPPILFPYLGIIMDPIVESSDPAILTAQQMQIQTESTQLSQLSFVMIVLVLILPGIIMMVGGDMHKPRVYGTYSFAPVALY